MLYQSILTTLIILFISSCGSSSDTNRAIEMNNNVSSDLKPIETTGELALYLTDMPTNVKAVFLSIKAIEVHKIDETQEDNATWHLVDQPQLTYNLLTLNDGTLKELGINELEAGEYDAVRIIFSVEPYDVNGTTHPFANYIVLEDYALAELDVVSGLYTGINIDHNFTISAGGKSNMVIDIDLNASIYQDMDEDWIMNPKIIIESSNEEINQSLVI